MPNICFSYQADVPAGIRNRGAAQPAPPGLAGLGYPCFSYPSGPCFSYPADVPRSMPLPCFSCSVDASLGVRNRDAAQPPLPGLRRMPGICFSY